MAKWNRCLASNWMRRAGMFSRAFLSLSVLNCSSTCKPSTQSKRSPLPKRSTRSALSAVIHSPMFLRRRRLDVFTVSCAPFPCASSSTTPSCMSGRSSHCRHRSTEPSLALYDGCGNPPLLGGWVCSLNGYTKHSSSRSDTRQTIHSITICRHERRSINTQYTTPS